MTCCIQRTNGAPFTALLPLTATSTAISATTAALGVFGVYRVTAINVTITISTTDITNFDGRVFAFIATNTLTTVGDPVIINTEGGENINNGTSSNLTFPFATLYVRSFGGALESISA